MAKKLDFTKQFRPAAKLAVVLLCCHAFYSLVDFKTANYNLDFSIRRSLGKEPTFSKKIKVYANDDRTVAENGIDKLRIEQWADLLETLDSKKPSSILIPYLFSKIPSLSAASGKVALERIKKIKTPIIAMIYFAPNEVVGKQKAPLSLTGQNQTNTLKSYSNNSFNEIKKNFKVDLEENYYGPPPELKDAFKLGHFQFPDTSSSYHIPFFLAKDGEDKAIVPHIALLTAGKNLKIVDEKIIANGSEVYLNEAGKIPLNFFSKISDTGDRVSITKRSLLYLLQNKKNSKSLKKIKEGDQIIILENYYTGGPRGFITTPLGNQTIASTMSIHLVNSVVTGNWIRELSWTQGFTLVYISILLGFFITQIFSPLMAGSISFLLAVLQVSLGVYLFSVHSIQWSWLTSSSMLLLSTILSVITEVFNIETKSLNLQRTLSGLLPPSQVAAAIKDPNSLDLKPQLYEVTIMFIDITGFSLTAKKMETNAIFSEVRDYLQEITNIILNHNGVVDKTLGDGMLCFFGFEIGRKQQRLNHAEEAIDCALKVQELCFERNLTARSVGKAILPLRIGINTAKVIIGNLGGQRRIDITMMGEGVNFASRLETACDPFKIMIGSSTASVMADSSISKLLVKRKIQIKHFDDMIDAYELNPYSENHNKLKIMQDLYWDWSNDMISEERYQIESKHGVVLKMEGTTFKLINFSLSGFQVHGASYYARGVTSNVSIVDRDKTIECELSDPHLMPFLVEVRSGKQLDDGSFVMGLYIPGLNARQKQEIFNALSKLSNKVSA